MFEKIDSDEKRENLLLYISCLVMAMGLATDVKPLLGRSRSTAATSMRRALINRASKNAASSRQIFTDTETFTGSAAGIRQRIASNISGRVCDPHRQDEQVISASELAWCHANGISFPFADQGFLDACRALEYLLIDDIDAALQLLTSEVQQNSDIISALDKHSGPKKVFIGGFGWSGSGAVFDAFRGYPAVDEMPGPQRAPFVNEGADSEPMLYQGPAGVMELSLEYLQNDAISARKWRKFFDLYILAENNKNYFDYKTMWANRYIREVIGQKAYYAIINQLLYDYALSKVTVSATKSGVKGVEAPTYRNADIFISFGQRLVNALFPKEDSIVLFNNAINTHKIRALEFAGSKCSYIAVDRCMLDQMADQRKNNIFFRFGAINFAFYKFEKLYKFQKNKKSVSRSNSTRFIETTFERWVENKEHRKSLTEKAIGDYNADCENQFFHPEKSIRNIGIASEFLTPVEIRILKAMNTLMRW